MANQLKLNPEKILLVDRRPDQSIEMSPVPGGVIFPLKPLVCRLGVLLGLGLLLDKKVAATFVQGPRVSKISPGWYQRLV